MGYGEEISLHLDDAEGTSTDNDVPAQYPGYPNRQMPWSAGFDHAVQSSGMQTGRCPHPNRDHCRKAIWKCGQEESCQTSVSRIGEAVLAGLSSRAWTARVSKTGRALAIEGRSDPHVEVVAGTYASSSSQDRGHRLICNACVSGSFKATRW